MVRPNGYDCSSCPNWDDINGCWANVKHIGEAPCYEEGGCCYEGEDEDIEYDIDEQK